MKSSIVLDLDGTLCNHLPRVHLGQAHEWDEYNRKCVEDQENEDVATIIRMLLGFASVRVIVVTGRNEKFRGITVGWLREHNIKADMILMRPDDDFTTTPELKIRLLEELFGGKEKVLEEILFALDDTEKVVEGFRNYGIPCWQVRKGMF